MSLPPICAAAGVGVPSLISTGLLKIVDQQAFTEYAIFILSQPSFEWTVKTSHLRVTALGTVFEDVTLTKTVSFFGSSFYSGYVIALTDIGLHAAFNNLPGVVITNPQFPGDKGDSILLETDTTISSPSNLGIELGDVRFEAYYGGSLGVYIWICAWSGRA